jgi:hypothetical protein
MYMNTYALQFSNRKKCIMKGSHSKAKPESLYGMNMILKGKKYSIFELKDAINNILVKKASIMQYLTSRRISKRTSQAAIAICSCKSDYITTNKFPSSAYTLVVSLHSHVDKVTWQLHFPP